MLAVAEVALLLTLPAVVIFAKLASVMPAVPDKFELVNPVREVTAVLTNAVVANCVVLVNAGAVIAVGLPVKEGERMVALNNISAVLVVMLAALELILVLSEVMLDVLDDIFVFNVFIEAILDVILEVFEFTLLVSVVSALVALVVSAVTDATLAIILLDKLSVSRFCNKLEVSVVLNLVPTVVVNVLKSTMLVFKLILLDKLAVSAFCNKLEVSVIFNFKVNAFLVASESGKFSAL